MFQDIFSLGIGQVVGDMTVALMCGFFISLLYRWTYKGPNYSTTFVHSLVSLSMITTIVIMVIGNNIARAFGLVGALSIIRFRTAIKDTQDIVFIFFALAVGMAAGVGLHLTAITGTIFIGAVIFVLSRTSYASPYKQDFVLQFSFMPHGEEGTPYLPVLEKHCKRHDLINLKSFGNGDMNGSSLGLSFYVNLKDKTESERFVRELGRVRGVNHVNLLFDEEQF
jgi:uncharacterized membrane protein YhiD involved in acid resistance